MQCYCNRRRDPLRGRGAVLEPRRAHAAAGGGRAGSGVASGRSSQWRLRDRLPLHMRRAGGWRRGGGVEGGVRWMYVWMSWSSMRRGLETSERRARAQTSTGCGPYFHLTASAGQPAPASTSTFQARQRVASRWRLSARGPGRAGRTLGKLGALRGSQIHTTLAACTRYTAANPGIPIVQHYQMLNVVGCHTSLLVALYLGWIANRRRPLPRLAVVCGAGGRRE